MAKLRLNALHGSTWLVVATLALVLILTGALGQIVVSPDIFGEGKYGPHFACVDQFEHGWPLTYLWRHGMVWQPALRNTSYWNVFDGVERASYTRLAADLVIGGVILAAMAAAFETWRRRRQSVLRPHLIDLMIFIAICGCGFTVLSVQVAENRKEHRLLAEMDQIEKRNGHDGTDVEWSQPASVRAQWQPGGPTWLRNLIGDRALAPLDRVVRLEVDARVVKHVAEMRKLQVLTIWGDPIASDDLRLLENHPSLEAIDMCFAAVEGRSNLPSLPRLRGLNLYEAGFPSEWLAKLPGLEVLELANTDLRDDDLRHLSRMTRLKDLSLGHEVTDDGLRHLAGLSRLERLHLDNSLSDRGLAHLAGLVELRHLSIGGEGITDEGLMHLKGLTGLEYLELWGTGGITDDGLTHLEGLTRLEDLELRGTSVTSDGVKALNRALPNCSIYLAQ